METFLAKAISPINSIIGQTLQGAQDSILGLDRPNEATTELNQQLDPVCQDLHDLEKVGTP